MYRVTYGLTKPEGWLSDYIAMWRNIAALLATGIPPDQILAMYDEAGAAEDCSSLFDGLSIALAHYLKHQDRYDLAALVIYFKGKVLGQLEEDGVDTFDRPYTHAREAVDYAEKTLANLRLAAEMPRIAFASVSPSVNGVLPAAPQELPEDWGGAGWDELRASVRAMLTYMVGRDSAPISDLEEHAWHKAEKSDGTIDNMLTDTRKFLERIRSPHRLRRRGAVVYWD